MKKTIIYLFLLLSYAALSASSYKIKDAEYNLEGSRSEFTGITREYALKTKVPLDFKRIFSDEEELMQYIHDVKQQIENTRNFDKVDVDFSVSEPDESDICNVFLIISTHDSMHFIAAPYPKYSSGDSLNLTVKVKDTNFLGSMETMTGEGKFAMELNDDDSVKDYLLGLGLDFETPFQLGAIDAAWNNSLEFSYTFGNSTPEWKIDSGVTLTKNFNKFSVVTSANQIFARNLDYEDEDVNGTNVHYGDGTYFGEKENAADFVLAHWLSGTFLWEQIRTTGGAYGAYASCLNLSGLFNLSTFRDPSPEKSVQTFKKCLEDAAGADFSEKECERAVTGTYGDEIQPHSPYGRGTAGFYRTIYCISEDDRHEKLVNLLAVKPNDVKKAAENLLKGINSSRTVVIENKTEKNASVNVKLPL